MSFVAEAWADIDVPPEMAFDVLLDHPGWKDWMPPSFAVASPPDGPLRVGARFRVRILGAPAASTLRLLVADRPREIAWSGGMRRVLHGEHRFLFESDGGGGTKVHSHEKWSGALAPLVRRLVKPMAERVGREQLAGLAAACRARQPGSAR